MKFRKVVHTNIMYKKVMSKLSFAILMSMYMAMSGCAIIASKHKLYDGEVANAVTILSSPTVQVTYIDNQDMGYSFVGQEKEFSVLPGEHTLIIEYADFWSPATGEDEKVVSAPVKLTFTAEPSQTYQLSHDRLITLESSKAFAKKPVFFVRNTVTDSVVDATIEMSAPKSFVSQFKFETTPEYQFVSDSPETKNTGRIGQLQKLWGSATKEEKTAFLQWITVK